MSKVIDSTSNNWYQEVAPRDYYLETDLERVVMHNLSLIFTEFTPVIFKDELTNRSTGRVNKPDLCMIKSDYSEWYVIEVELGKHSKTEVLNQIETFRDCDYTLRNADYIYRRNSSFDQTRLRNLITHTAPELMVIVNELKADWKTALSRLQCKMCVFQIYNDFDGRRIYRLEGEHPFIFTNFRNCRYEKELPYAVKILNEEGFLDALNIRNGMNVSIEFNGINHTWQRKDEANEVYLICNSIVSPLDSLSSRYRLNFYRTSWIKQPSGRWPFLSKCFKKPRKETHNLFSFTKD